MSSSLPLALVASSTVAGFKEGDEFDDFDEFFTKLQAYGQQESVQWVICDSKRVLSANKMLAKSAIPYDNKFVYRYAKFRCKHGGQRRSTGTGRRPNQRSFKLTCPAVVLVSVNRKLDKLVVQRVSNEHNHELDRELFKQYPEQRRLDKQTEDLAKTMMDMKVKVKLLKNHLQAKGSHYITTKDLYNIRQKAKKQQNRVKSDEDLLLDELEKLGEANRVTIQTGDNGELDFLLIATGDMRESFCLFPEVLMIDSTYTQQQIHLYIFLVEDSNGKGRVVGYGLVANREKIKLENLIAAFGKIHDLSLVKTLILDENGDSDKIFQAQKSMPTASVQICKFHVTEAFQREIKKCGVDTIKCQALSTAISQMVFAKSEKMYTRAHESFIKNAPQNIVDYFNDIWLDHIHTWCALYTNAYINLGNTPNYGLDKSLNQKVKCVLDRYTSIPNIVRNLLQIDRPQQRHEVSYTSFRQKMTVPYSLNNDDRFIDAMMKQLTPHAVSIATQELDKAKKYTGKYAKNTENCCYLKRSMGLPCRHLFANRLQNEEDLFKDSDVLDRWRVGYEDRSHKRKADSDSSAVTTQSPKRKRTPSSKDEKLKEIMTLFKSMANLVSTREDTEFERKLDFIKELYKMWQNEEKKENIQEIKQEESNGIEDDAMSSKAQEEQVDERGVQSGGNKDAMISKRHECIRVWANNTVVEDAVSSGVQKDGVWVGARSTEAKDRLIVCFSCRQEASMCFCNIPADA